MKNKTNRRLRNNRGEGTYISTVVFVLIAVIFIGFVINLFSVINAKQQMDTAVDQLVRQIQLAGEVTSKTDRLFTDITGNIQAAEDLKYTVSTTYYKGKKIQLGTAFSVKVTGTAYLGAFGDFGLFPINLVSYGAGVSEEYWK